MQLITILKIKQFTRPGDFIRQKIDSILITEFRFDFWVGVETREVKL